MEQTQINLLDPATFADGHPWQAYQALRATAPVYLNPEPDGAGFWALSRYADVLAVDRDFETFSSEPTIMISDPPAEESAFLGGAKMMLMMDPPRHTAFRRIVRARFAQPSATAAEGWLRLLARQIVSKVTARGECDFVAEIAGEMPSLVIARLLGLPPEDGRELYRLTEAIHSDPGVVGPGAARDAVLAMFSYGMDVIRERRARPGDDLASHLLGAMVEGRPLSDAEFLLYFLLLVDAGGDTTRNLLSGGLLAMMQAPEQLDWLRSEVSERLPRAREELLRFTSPVIYMRRTATRRLVMHGVQIGRGDKVVMYFGAANRDPSIFHNPDQLDLSRDVNAHVAFGGGPHVCLGRHLARLEIDAVFTEVLAHLHDLRLLSQPEWLPSTFISGPQRLEIGFRGLDT